MTEGPVYLLDGNLLIAQAVADHVHHDAAERWSMARRHPFATCPITQGSLVRFLVRRGARTEGVLRVLIDFLSSDEHRFWPDDVGYDRIELGAVVGHRQVTDAYLAGLARARGGRLATLDQGLAALHPDVAELVPV